MHDLAIAFPQTSPFFLRVLVIIDAVIVALPPQESFLVSARLTFAQPLISPVIASPLARMQAANGELFRIGNAYEIIHRESVSALDRLKVRSHLAATKGKGCCKDERRRAASTAWPRSYNCRR